MKIRIGFVSNSSSSSFVIFSRVNEKGKIEFDPKDFGDIIKTEEDLKGMFDYLETDEERKGHSEYNKYLEKIKNGGIIIRGSVEQGSEDEFESFLKNIVWEEQ